MFLLIDNIVVIITMDLNTLIAECTTYDFKLMLEEKKPKSWLKSVSAFANGLGGSLFFGIDNDGIARGLDDVQHVCEAISTKIRDYMILCQRWRMIPHDMDGLHILAAQSRGRALYSVLLRWGCSALAFVRVGDRESSCYGRIYGTN